MGSRNSKAQSLDVSSSEVYEHDQTTNIWCHNSLNDEDTWWPMSPDITAKLEQNYQIYLADGTDNHEIKDFTFNFSEMKQYRGTTFIHSVCRLSQDEYQGLHNEYIKSILGLPKIWVCVRQDEMIIFSPMLQKILNQAELTESGEVNTDFYSFNTHQNYQINSSTREHQEIRKIDPQDETNRPIIGSFNFIYN